MALWGVLRPGARAGVYAFADVPREVSNGIGAHLAEALLRGSGREALPAADIAAHPALFPFAVRLSGAELRKSPRLELHRTGLDMDLIGLCMKQSTEPVLGGS
jgi:hypothetical protein